MNGLDPFPQIPEVLAPCSTIVEVVFLHAAGMVVCHTPVKECRPEHRLLFFFFFIVIAC